MSVDPRPFAMLVDSQKSFHWVLPTLKYGSKEDLLDDENLKTYIIDRAVAKREELEKLRTTSRKRFLFVKKALNRSPHQSDHMTEVQSDGTPSLRPRWRSSLAKLRLSANLLEQLHL